jgi:hypothetical protein
MALQENGSDGWLLILLPGAWPSSFLNLELPFLTGGPVKDKKGGGKIKITIVIMIMIRTGACAKLKAGHSSSQGLGCCTSLLRENENGKCSEPVLSPFVSILWTDPFMDRPVHNHRAHPHRRRRSPTQRKRKPPCFRDVIFEQLNPRPHRSERKTLWTNPFGVPASAGSALRSVSRLSRSRPSIRRRR